MKERAGKNILCVLISLVFIVALTFVFIYAILPQLSVDYDSLAAQERLKHDDVLDSIIEDFTIVVSLESVETKIEDGKIDVVIHGEYCDLNATLNKNMEVIKLNEENHASEKQGGPASLTAAIVILSGVLIGLIIHNIVRIIKIVRNNRQYKLKLKLQKQKDNCDKKVEVIV